MEVDLVLKNAVVVSMDKHKNYYSSVAVKEGIIVELGNDENELNQFIGKNTKVIDLNKKVIVPGFIDAHQHIFKTGLKLNQLNCNVTSIKELVQNCKEYANKVNDVNTWILGRGYDEESFEEKRLPVAKDFEGIDNPIFLEHYSGHSGVANNKAMDIANITSHTWVDYGSIELGNDGKPTGVLIEGATKIVKEELPAYTDKELKDALKSSNQCYIKYGITSVHEAGMGMTLNSLDEFRILQESKEDGELKVRIYAMVLDKFFDDIDRVKLRTGFGNPDLKIGSVKIFTDGTLSGKTAAVRKPYKNSNNYGEKVHSPEELQEFILKVHKKGYQIACHAIGDDAVEDVIDAYEKALETNPNNKVRHRIEHVSVSDTDLLKRMKKLNITPVPQPVFLYFAGDVYMEYLNKELEDSIITLKRFIDEGLYPAGSSDSPVQNPSPFLGMYAAMERKTIHGDIVIDDQKISLYEALKMYTTSAAFVANEEEVKGSIEIGKLADLTVLPEGFLDFSAEEVKLAEVEMTIINGKIEYKK